MKKNLFLAGVLMIAGAASAGSRVTDNFDWGAGVAGRTAIASGQALADGMATQVGGATWVVGTSVAKFSGAGGSGNGTMTMSGANSAVKFSYQPAGGWTSGVVVATAKAAFFSSGTGGASLRACYMGFQDTVTNAVLLPNQTTDVIRVKLNDTGVLTFTAIIAGTTYKTPVTNNIAFAQGSTVTFKMTIDAANKTATLITTGASNVSTNVLSWTAAATVPNWGAFNVTESGNSTLIVDSVGIVVDPATIGMLGFATPPRAIPLI